MWINRRLRSSFLNGVSLDLSSSSIPDTPISKEAKYFNNRILLKESLQISPGIFARNLRISNIVAPGSSTFFYKGSFDYDLVKDQSFSVGERKSPHSIPIRFTVNSIDANDNRIGICLPSDPKELCLHIGGQFNTQNPQKCMIPDDQSLVCESLGGNFTGPSDCQIPETSLSGQENCELVGGVYYEGKCTLSDPKESCIGLGGTFDEASRTCQFSGKGDEELCLALGFKFEGGDCKPDLDSKELCEGLGSGWTWQGSNCNPPAKGSQPPPITYTQTCQMKSQKIGVFIYPLACNVSCGGDKMLNVKTNWSEFHPPNICAPRGEYGSIGNCTLSCARLN